MARPSGALRRCGPFVGQVWQDRAEPSGNVRPRGMRTRTGSAVRWRVARPTSFCVWGLRLRRLGSLPRGLCRARSSAGEPIRMPSFRGVRRTLLTTVLEIPNDMAILASAPRHPATLSRLRAGPDCGGVSGVTGALLATRHRT
ncbi:hypothetical protein GCM10010251_59490 [Streptomyces aurantiogriseus]|uniref:Uncharacterized protein n=1 Tax=Streptomyces aurantiogriseus TaxID=66870 RepID=A0A918FFT4_9ACTN|nr:hypothetical protein GCM10010251_59490 [Streptomyces aurantiogriseus]